MNQPDSDCFQLLDKTASALDNRTLQALFVSTQQMSLDSCANIIQCKSKYSPCAALCIIADHAFFHSKRNEFSAAFEGSVQAFLRSTTQSVILSRVEELDWDWYEKMRKSGPLFHEERAPWFKAIVKSTEPPSPATLAMKEIFFEQLFDIVKQNKVTCVNLNTFPRHCFPTSFHRNIS